MAFPWQDLGRRVRNAELLQPV